jgi:hypothetical protein
MPKALTSDASPKPLEDFYLIGLWSYCGGERTGDVETITYCSPPQLQFWFNPTDVWGLKDAALQDALGDNLRKGLDVYGKIIRFLSWAFISATILTAAEIVLCPLAAYWRVGSRLIWVFSIVSSSSIIWIGALVLIASRRHQSLLL